MNHYYTIIVLVFITTATQQCAHSGDSCLEKSDCCESLTCNTRPGHDTCMACPALGIPCSTANETTSLCCPNTYCHTTMHLCLPCLLEGRACGGAPPCCGDYVCNLETLTCQQRPEPLLTESPTKVPKVQCQEVGNGCLLHTDCCAGYCKAGHCTPCAHLSEYCDVESDCCGGHQSLTCNGTHCIVITDNVVSVTMSPPGEEMIMPATTPAPTSEPVPVTRIVGTTLGTIALVLCLVMLIVFMCTTPKSQ